MPVIAVSPDEELPPTMSGFDLRKICEEERLTLEILADAFNVHEVTICRMKNREADNPMSVFMLIAALARKPPDKIWTALGQVPRLRDWLPPPSQGATS